MIVEIRAAEGGDDAKQLVAEQFALYRKRADRRSLKVDVIERLPALLTFRVTGSGANAAFENEAGGHRWQRVPPNEKRGRVHTSTVTVAVLPEYWDRSFTLDPSEVVTEVTRGSGPGGQHRNKTESCVVVKHTPSGLSVRCDEGRSQSQNRELALALLAARVRAAVEAVVTAERSKDRKRQVGSGMRGDKRRTIRMQDGIVTDHVTGDRWQLKNYLRGEW